MSLYQKASLVQIPSGYKAADAKLYSVVPNNGDGDFTVSSDADATRVNKDGLIQTTVANQARLNYDPTNPQDPHLLLEPTRLNRVFPNNTLSGYSTLNATVSNNNSTSPDGASNASLITSGSGGTIIGVFKGFSGASASVTHNISVFLKKGTYDRIKVQEGFANANMVVDLSNGTEVSSQNSTNKKIEAYPNDWYRISFNFTSASSGNLQFSLFVDGTTSTGITFYAFGGQIEQGNYATSLIPTSGSAVTRTKDRCTGGGDDNLFNDSEGVVFVDAEALSDADVNRYITLSDGTATNAILIQYRNNGELRLYNGGIGSSNLIFSDSGADLTDRKKIAIQYGTTANDYKIYIDGVSKTVSGSFTATTMSGLDRFRFDYVIDTLEFYGKVYQAMTFNEALTDAELQTLTSYDSFGQMAKALLYTIE